jgi:hypothetical protein
MAVLGAEQAMLPALGLPALGLPALGIAKPTPYYGMEAVGTGASHHVVYASVGGLVYDYL